MMKHKCLSCKQITLDRHPNYDRLCPTCGSLNLAKRNQVLDLSGRTAIVTGARVKIGYAVALKLLRYGATVLATSRFPHDAAQRFAQEVDFEQWRDRLHIYALELRHLAHVEQFTQQIRQQYSHLEIIINNAAQTIRRPPIFYKHLIPFESLAIPELPDSIQPLLRQNESTIVPYSESNDLPIHFSQMPLLPEDREVDLSLFPPGQYSEDRQQLDLRSFNSWLMRDDEVSLVELLEVHIINAIAPFVINSRLKSLMMNSEFESRHIINVSSVEGRFQDEKPWRHPHTNMAKASLHMMTRTCAKDYAKSGIYMNCVDPGWISFQHPTHQVEEMRSRGDLPLYDEIDAAARILDPICTSLNQGSNRFGKLYKDYLEVSW
jgi:NAD(P)-dependent dehydrogenase (short-subunit alcohol dehydrogenase family)